MRWIASRIGVSARLIGTITLPLVLLTVMLGDATVEARSTAQSADRVAESTAVLKQLVRLRTSLYIERLADEMLRPGRRPPADLLATTAFGAEFLSDPWAIRRRSDEALVDLDPANRPFSAELLGFTRRDPLRRNESSGEKRIDELDTLVMTAMNEHLVEVRDISMGLGDRRIVELVTTLQRSVALPEQAGILLASLVDLWSDEPLTRLADQSAVVDALARFDVSSGRMTSALVGDDSDAAAVWSAAHDPPRSLAAALRSAVSGDLSDPTRPSGEPVSVGIAMLQGIDWLVDMNRVPTVAAQDVVDRSERLVADARAAEERTILLAALAVLACVSAAVLFGRSIAAPVRRFSDQAIAVGEGRLDVEPLRLRGPPEIIRASSAFNEMVANLHLLEQKSRALADTDFAHPALQRPLPGLLGASLQRSIEVLSDSIEEREQLQRRLGFEATHDPLTGLGNRAALIAALHRTLASARDGESVAVIFIDLDDFKPINDRHGHAAGDELLRTVGARMQERIPHGALLARLGGDEFVCALPRVVDPDEVVDVAHRLVAAAAAPVPIDGRPLQVGASAGVAVSAATREGREDPLELLRKADLAVYTAKRAGGSQSVSVYDDELDHLLAAEDDLAGALRDALAPGVDELHLRFQPVVDAATGAPVGFESLLRWSRYDGGVGPDRFIPIAEKSGLIVDLDRWVLRRVLGQLREWSGDARFDGLRVSVNVSGRSVIDPGFVAEVLAALDDSGVDPRHLAIEVTETAIVTDMELAAAQLAELRRHGISVAIDDFGTGYTSIAHLRALPVDTIKIDSSFVHNLTDADDLVFVQMIIQLAHELDIPTVAEGVETVEQLERLRSVGCDRIQGYLFSPPLPSDEVAGWITSRAPEPGALVTG